MSAAPEDAAFQARVAWLLQAAADAFTALQAPDPDLDHERRVIWARPPTTSRRPAA